MKPARIVFPAFWFGKSDIKQAEELARLGVGGFCLYGGTAAQTLELTRHLNSVSPYGRLLFCADIKDDLCEVIQDAPALPKNHTLAQNSSGEMAYRKGNMLGRMARAAGLDWVLAPVVDLGYAAPSISDNPQQVSRIAGDMLAGLSNAGALTCLKYFPGVSGALKTLVQLEDTEFIPYKNLFRRTDAVMPSDMTFVNVDSETQACMSDKVIKGLLRKRLNYKGCIMGFPLHAARLRYEEASAVKMLHAGVENILAPRDAFGVIAAIEREVNRGLLLDHIVQSISNHEMFISKVTSGPEPGDIKTVFAQAQKAF